MLGTDAWRGLLRPRAAPDDPDDQYRGRLKAAARSIASVRTWVHMLRLAHFASYSHVQEVRKISRGFGVRIAPNASFRNGERITIGQGSHIGERDIIWAGNSHSRVVLGEFCLLAPGVVITASNYGIDQSGTPVMHQAKVERDILIGRDVWLGANVVVLAGVKIGDGVVIAAGAVVTKDLPAQCIAAGVPARVVGMRPAAPGHGDATSPTPLVELG